MPANPNEDRPELFAQEGDLSVITPEAWEVLSQDNNPPRLFKYGNSPQRFETDGDRWLLRELDENVLRYEVTRAAFWYKINKEGEKVCAVPGPYIIKNMLATPDLPLPELTRVVETPVFNSKGELIQEPGYHPSGIYLSLTKDLNVPKVSEIPSDEEINIAKEWIDELLYDFHFASDGEKPNLIAVFIEPFAREMIHGPTPLRLIEAPTPGSGKGLLSKVITCHATKQPGLITQCQNDEEWNKSLLAQLKANKSIILIDNISTALDSGSLAAALTSEYYGGRLLGTNETAQYPNRALWLATANNPTMTTEIARRTVRIRLEVKQDRPWLREGFKHKDLGGWALDNRGTLIWAALTLIQHWISQGQPEYSGKPLGSFENWSKVAGGILQTAGIEGFLSNLNEFYEEADSEGAVLRNFVEQWWAKFGTDKVSVSELFSLTSEYDSFDLGKGGERSQRITFGKLLGRQRDRIIGDYAIKSAGVKDGKAVWRLVTSKQESLF